MKVYAPHRTPPPGIKEVLLILIVTHDLWMYWAIFWILC